MSESPRLNAILPLKVLVGTDTQTHFAHTVDISPSGARIIMPLALETGCELVLEYKNKRARAVVIWSKQMRNSSRDHELGLNLLDDGRRFWLVEFSPKAQVLS